MKSHQDDDVSEEELPREEQMNGICDRLAKQCVASLKKKI